MEIGYALESFAYPVFLPSAVSNCVPPAMSPTLGHSRIAKEPGPLGARKLAAMVPAVFLPVRCRAACQTLTPEGLHHLGLGNEGWEQGSSHQTSAKEASVSATSSD